MRSSRLALHADIPLIVDLVDSAYRGDKSRAGWTTEAHLLDGQRTDQTMLAESLADPGQRILLLEQAGTLQGCVTVENRSDHGYISMVSVRPDSQRAGAGRQLLEIAETYLREVWTLTVARITVIAQRAELIAWYERRGYARTGKTQAFPYGDSRIGLPRRDDLFFVILEKLL
jgi:ribosomal protein S18 acetylase RimI-like enzyme